MAAWTPFLRTLFRDLNKKLSSKKYYVSETGDSPKPSKLDRSTKTATTITANRTHHGDQQKSDHSSDKSFLGQDPGCIVKTNEVDIEFENLSVRNGSREGVDIGQAV